MAAASAYELVEKGLFQDAARVIDQSLNAPQDLRVLRVRLESHVGIPQRARIDAQGLLSARLDHHERTICWEVIGRVALSTGMIAEGLRAMRQAFAAAAAIQDAKIEARLTASYIESLLHCVGVEPATLEMPRLRKAALRAGDAYSLVELHSLDAEIKAKRGSPAAAVSSIETANALLEKFPNIAQQGRLANVASAVAIIQCDYESALQRGLEALSCARSTGTRTLRIPALNNLAYIRLAQRQFNDARAYLDELLATVVKGGSTEIGVLDTQMMLALATDDLAKASELAELIKASASHQQGQDSYYELWHLPTRIRWLYRIGNTEEGLRFAQEAIPRVERTFDQNLVQRMRLLAAEGLGRLGRQEAAVIQMAQATSVNRDPSLELVAESFRVAGLLASLEMAPDASEYFERASRILAGTGNLSAQADVEREARELAAIPSRPRETSSNVISAGRPVEPRGKGRNTQLTERIGALMEMGFHIPLLTTEAVSILIETDSVLYAAATKTSAEGKREAIVDYSTSDSSAPRNERDAVRIELGTHLKHHYEILCKPRPNVSGRTTVLSVERLIQSALAIAKSRQLARDSTALWQEAFAEKQLGLICSSEQMIKLVNTIRRVAATPTTVLLTGETGVGKELFARALHQSSPRSDRAFLPFNCSTVPRDMLDSQLFGHKRGSFTGAQNDAPGIIRSAHGGTLFLDEVGEMAIETQPKLLRFLESGEILPLGESKPIHVDVRIVAATNANLDQLVSDGRFREDLYYRLNVIPINIPPLRERREEIPALVAHFLEEFGREQQKPLLRIADETLEYLVLYRWPGNVRQLANEIRRLVAMAEPGAVLMPAHLSDDIAASRRTVPVNTSPRLFNEVIARIDQPLSAIVEHVERAAIQRALSMSDGRLDEAAKMLGLSRKGLYLKRQRLKLG